MQGLQVQGLSLFDNHRGIYIKWDIVDPGFPRFPNEHGTYDEEYTPSPPVEPMETKIEEEEKPHKETWCDRDPNTGMCRLERLLNDPRDYFCSDGPFKGLC